MPINPLAGGPDDEDLQKKNKALDQGSSTNVSNVGQATSVGAAAPATQNASGSFTNLNQYTEANKDQGAGLGGKLVQNVQNTANQGLNQLGQSQQEFGKAQEAAGVRPEDYDINKVTTIAQKVYNDPNSLQQADIESAQRARERAAAFTAGTDTGPKNLNELTSYQQAAGTIKGAQDKVGLTGTESGRETLLRETYKRPDYSKGQSGLDQLLTQNVPQNRQKFESLRTNLLGQYGLGDQQNQAIQAAAAKRGQVIEGTQQAASNVNQALWGTPEDQQKAGVLGTYEQQLLGRPGLYNQTQTQNIDEAKKAIENYLGSISTMGLSKADLVNQIVQSKGGVGGATLANTTSQQDLARINALNKLAGRDPNLIGTTALTSVDSNQFNPGINPNYTAAQNAINQRVSALNNEVKNIASQGVTSSLGQAYGRDIASADGINYAIGRVNKNMNNPRYDAEENQKVVNALQGKLDAINAARGKYGLGTLQVLNTDSQPHINQKWEEMRSQIKQQYLSPFLNPRLTDEQAQKMANKWIADRQGLAKFNDFRNAVYTSGKVVALYNKLLNLQNNPGQSLGKTQLESAPTFQDNTPQTIDTTKWPIGPNGKPINPATILPYKPQPEQPVQQPSVVEYVPGNTTTPGGGRMFS